MNVGFIESVTDPVLSVCNVLIIAVMTIILIIIIIIITCPYILCSLVSFLTLCFGAYGLFPWRPERQAAREPSHLSKKDQSAQWCEPQAGEHHLPNPQPGLKHDPAHGSSPTNTHTHTHT